MGMDPRADEGLGLSVLVYAAALLFGLAAIVLPVIYMNGPKVLENPDAASVHAMLAEGHEGNSFPLAFLHHDPIVDPATVAALNAKVKQPRREVARSTPRPREETSSHAPRSVADLGYERQPRRSFFPFFSLF